MAFEFEDNLSITEESKKLFRNSSVWIRTFSILSLIVYILYLLFFIVGYKDGEAQFLNAMPRNMGSEILEAFQTLFRAMMIFFLVTLVLMLFASYKLLNAGNAFKEIEITGKAESYTKAFNSFKIFWMVMGISIIISIVVFIYLVVTMMSAFQAVAPH